MSELNLTDASFDAQVMKSDKPVLVDLWAPWCGPCRALAPVVEEVSKEYEGKALVAKLNTDDNPETAAKLRVSAIPTLVFVKDGKVVEQLVGVQSKAAIKARLDALIMA